MREGLSADVPEMESVYQRSWRGAYESMLGPTTLEKMAAERAKSFDWMQGVSAPDSQVLVADHDGEIVGIAQAIETSRPTSGPPRDLDALRRPETLGRGCRNRSPDG